MPNSVTYGKPIQRAGSPSLKWISSSSFNFRHVSPERGKTSFIPLGKTRKNPTIGTAASLLPTANSPSTTKGMDLRPLYLSTNFLPQRMQCLLPKPCNFCISRGYNTGYTSLTHLGQPQSPQQQPFPRQQMYPLANTPSCHTTPAAFARPSQPSSLPPWSVTSPQSPIVSHDFLHRPGIFDRPLRQLHQVQPRPVTPSQSQTSN
jgi:hypothetical protein